MLAEFAAPNVHTKAVGMLKGLNGSLLDLGCGQGAISERIMLTYPNKFNITASDFNKKDFRAKVKFIKADLNKFHLPFKDNSFDVVMLVEVIEHVENPALLINEINRILKKKGILIMSTPNVENWQSKIHFLLNGRFFSFLKSDTSSNNLPGMAHVNPLFDFQLNNLIRNKYVLIETAYNRMRIPVLKHKIPSSTRFFGEIKIMKLQKC